MHNSMTLRYLLTEWFGHHFGLLWNMDNVENVSAHLQWQAHSSNNAIVYASFHLIHVTDGQNKWELIKENPVATSTMKKLNLFFTLFSKLWILTDKSRFFISPCKINNDFMNAFRSFDGMRAISMAEGFIQFFLSSIIRQRLVQFLFIFTQLCCLVLFYAFATPILNAETFLPLAFLFL